jgi:hypothetical protein
MIENVKRRRIHVCQALGCTAAGQHFCPDHARYFTYLQNAEAARQQARILQWSLEQHPADEQYALQVKLNRAVALANRALATEYARYAKSADCPMPAYGDRLDWPEYMQGARQS